MLCQLVCVDRRYQRMNCFNIRELQGILKRRFFTDLVNSSDHHKFLNESTIGLRFKSLSDSFITADQQLFYKLGTTNSSKVKTANLYSMYNGNVVNLFSSETINSINSSNTLKNELSESSDSFRNQRFLNALISYDYKTGHYLGVWDQLYPSLMTSFIEVARGIRKAP
jgi:sulfite reductase alpha subunit-like flavoprotein